MGGSLFAHQNFGAVHSLRNKAWDIQREKLVGAVGIEHDPTILSPVT